MEHSAYQYERFLHFLKENNFILTQRANGFSIYVKEDEAIAITPTNDSYHYRRLYNGYVYSHPGSVSFDEGAFEETLKVKRDYVSGLIEFNNEEENVQDIT